MDQEKFEGFQYWLADMDDAIERFIRILPQQTRDNLDYSPDSLLVLENELLSRYPNVDSARKKSESRFIDGAARYTGEVIRKHAGGKWFINLEDSRNVYYRIPQLKCVNNQITQICPLAMTTTAISRRKGDFLYRFLKKKIGDTL